MQEDRPGDHIELRQAFDRLAHDERLRVGLVGFDVIYIVCCEKIRACAVDAHVVCQIALQIGIDDEHALAKLRHNAPDVKAEHCFADAALERSKGDDFCHGQSLQ